MNKWKHYDESVMVLEYSSNMPKSQSQLFGYYHSLELPHNANEEFIDELKRKRKDFQANLEEVKLKTGILTIAIMERTWN